MLGVQHKNIYATIVKLDHAFIALCCTRLQQYFWQKTRADHCIRAQMTNLWEEYRLDLCKLANHANFYPSSREIRFMICLDHFSTDCFERLFHLDGLQRRLKPDSVPTIWRKAPAQLLVSYILEHSKRVFIYVSISIPKLSSNRDNWDLNIYIWILPLHVLTWELVMILMWCCIFPMTPN
jgi:hypothetical protein